MDKSLIWHKIKVVLGLASEVKEDETEKYDDNDLNYMRSLAAAVAEDTPSFMRWVVVAVAGTVLVLLLWMAWAELDTVVRASGKVIPSSQVQRIQSLEGGVVSEILVDEGDQVEINQPLARLSDISFAGSYEEGQIKYYELKARALRLTAEANGSEMQTDDELAAVAPELLQREQDLFVSNRDGLQSNIRILREQLTQSENHLLEVQARGRQMERNLALLQQELRIKQPLVASGVISEVEYLQLQGRESDAVGELETINLSIPRIQSVIEESRNKLDAIQLEFVTEARRELNEVTAEMSRTQETQVALADRVARTTLRSPTQGTVKVIYANTIGGVVRPGDDIIEIVPSEDSLLVEVRIRPSDIANVEVGQPARIKFTAYDFAIYGSMEGTLKFISADTITDEEGISYYLARIEPSQDFLGAESRNLQIKVGMTSEVDIVTGKKTILENLLKPINRAMENALREG